MGAQFATVVGWIFGLIFVYLLLTHGSDTQGIIGSSFKGGVSLVKSLQGR